LDEPEGISWENIRHHVDFIKGKIDVTSEKRSGTSVHLEFEI